MDKIFMKRLSFYGYHGAYAEENRLGQRFYVDLEMKLDLKPAGTTDDLQKYRRLRSGISESGNHHDRNPGEID